MRRQEKIATYYPVLFIINRFYAEVHMRKSTHLYQGQKFHKLTVISLHHVIVKRKKNGDKLTQEYYLCKCDCGKETNKIYTIPQLCNKLNILYGCLYARIQRKNKNLLAKFSIINTKEDQQKIDNAK